MIYIESRAFQGKITFIGSDNFSELVYVRFGKRRLTAVARGIWNRVQVTREILKTLRISVFPSFPLFLRLKEFYFK